MTAVLIPTESAPQAPEQALPPAPSASQPVSPGRHELERIAQLRSSGVLVTRPQSALDALARTAAALCGVELGLVNFLDEATQTTAASVGWLEAGFAAEMPRSESVCQFTITSTEEVTEIGDLSVDPRTEDLPLNSDGLRFYAGASVLSESKAALGAVCVLDRTTHVLTAAQRQGLQDLAAVAATLIEQHALAQRLVGVADRLGQQADTDTLTGLYNRRALEPVLANLPPRTAVAMLDLDHFKALNDRAGHHAGDQALCGFAELFKSGLRTGDVAARWGGEEFLVVLNNVDEPRRVLDRILADARSTLPVTFSAGLTVAGVGEDPVELLQRADRLLYQAKRAGRDRIVDDLSTT
jgi:diguanylate cyclase (GGDEF)-like protein